MDEMDIRRMALVNTLWKKEVDKMRKKRREKVEKFNKEHENLSTAGKPSCIIFQFKKHRDYMDGRFKRGQFLRIANDEPKSWNRFPIDTIPESFKELKEMHGRMIRLVLFHLD
jgi:hypothetical protein